jgi:hypothetical protein
LHRD